ncbi:aspartate aminotransferase family protein [Planosporangium flavigriseum]|nr:aminotransferase class III-fold pyridoxal phosphate-dependent enzyme [Planosporangium flavigriseum]NJC62993.1 aspartate aminotransferase family protein [Planosporangium flavigriseum]
MHAVRRDEFIVDRADDVWVYDTEGRRYLDATASLWYCNIGHGRREIAEAVAAQLTRLEAYSVFGDYSNTPARELAHRLAGYAPMADAKVFLTSGGGDSVDTAVKIALTYWRHQGRPERTHVISRVGSYHGMHGIGTGLGGIDANRNGFDGVFPTASRVANNDAAALRAEIERLGADRVAAFIAEPVIGAGGVVPPAPGYLEAVAGICEQYGVLFVADAVICGFGRLGTWYGVERWGLRPDMITFAKGVTSGYLPLGGVVASGDVAAPFWDEPGRPFRHGQTYAGHATCAAAAMANLDIMEAENLLDRALKLETELHTALLELTGHDAVTEVRGGIGVLSAVEIHPDVLARDPGVLGKLHLAARRRGVLIRPLITSLAISPPLTISSEYFAHITEVIADALDEVTVP